ncbi:MAG: phosphonate ABC transporter, permease protein PhnE [Rhodobacteraceae bacterium]|nr:MAG: phosphonate ABC transporter, permease protein PhnE [Paracoccaceae bacterium]
MTIALDAPTAGPRRWRKPPMIADARLRYALYALILVYLYVALSSVTVNYARILVGLDRGAAFVSGFLSPNFTTRWRDISNGMLESLTMTVISTAVGVLLSIPVALGAARNVAPPPIYVACRGLIAVSRAFQEVVIAIVFVAMFGFGPFAGAMTLAFSTIGFLGKLLAEDIEDIDRAQVEAIRASGASWPQLMNYAVQPQVAPRFIGLCLYRLDINFREASVIGIVGAGGIGATLNTALARYEYDSAAAILLSIIVVVFIAEYSSGFIRKRFL